MVRVSSSQVGCSFLRRHSLIWFVLLMMGWSGIPMVSLAQSPNAQIASLKGTALVNGQPAAQGMTVRAGDIIETQVNASLVVMLPDGSQIEVGESTQLDVAELLTTATGARTSRLKLAWGWVRAKLSSDYNTGADARFEIETPNALVGVKFSPPDTRVSYDPKEQKTVAKGFNNMLDVLNKITGERIVAQIGETVTVTAAGIIVAGAAGAFSAKTIAISAGAVAAAGGVAALALSGKNDDEVDASGFIGTFLWQPAAQTEKKLEIESATSGQILIKEGVCYGYWFAIAVDVQSSTRAILTIENYAPDICAIDEHLTAILRPDRNLAIEEWGVVFIRQ